MRARFRPRGGKDTPRCPGRASWPSALPSGVLRYDLSPLVLAPPVVVEDLQVAAARLRPKERFDLRPTEPGAGVQVLGLCRAELGQRRLVASDQDLGPGGHLGEDRRQVLFEFPN